MCLVMPVMMTSPNNNTRITYCSCRKAYKKWNHNIYPHNLLPSSTSELSHRRQKSLCSQRLLINHTTRRSCRVCAWDLRRTERCFLQGFSWLPPASSSRSARSLISPRLITFRLETVSIRSKATSELGSTLRGMTKFSLNSFFFFGVPRLYKTLCCLYSCCTKAQKSRPKSSSNTDS